MELHQVTPKLKTISLPREEALIMPIGDVQVGDPRCDEERFKKHIKWGVEHGAYFLGMGEFVDIASPSNRDKYKGSRFYDSFRHMADEAAEEHIRRVLDLMDGSQGRWLGVLEGHHFWEFEDGSTTDMRIARELGCPFLGNCAIVRLEFDNASSHLRRAGVDIWAHHGVGSGRKVTSPILLLLDVLSYWEADIYLMGHQHKIIATPIDRLYPVWGKNPRLQHKTKILACTGSFLRGYEVGSTRVGTKKPEGTYIEKQMLNPASLGGILLKVRPRVSEGFVNLDLGVEL